MSLHLETLFESLVIPLEQPAGRSFSAVPIPQYEGYKLAKDSSGSPCLLLRQTLTSSPTSPTRLQNLIVSYSVPCLISHPDREQEEGVYTIIRCSNVDSSLFPHFLRILSPIIATLGPTPTAAAVRKAIAGLVELFQALTAPAKKSIQGLWAELFMICHATDPHELARAWHQMPIDTVDFICGKQRLEVKSSSTRKRIHHFSLLQLTPPAHVELLVASIFVESIGGGVSLNQITAKIRALLVEDPPLLVRFDSILYASLGVSWQEVMEESFDAELALESLQFYESSRVPQITGAIPSTVNDIRFTSDLSDVHASERDSMLSAGGLFAAAVCTD